MRNMRNQRNELYRAAIYCRLSDEDYRKKRDVSESIENQIAICTQYIENHDDIELVDTYIDDGHTGLNYKRDGYLQMMEDIDDGKIDCIVTKSLARLGREHSETIKLFKETFVIKRIRYIAVVDNIDFNGKITSIEIPIKVVMNDNYSMEISKNIRSAFEVKAERGEFLGSFATYGYKKDEKDKNHLVIDEAAAEIVRRIYAEFISGKNISAIAHDLNDDKIPCPSEYKKLSGSSYCNNKRLEKTYYWTYSTVKKIILNQNENYIGNMVQHRSEKLAYNIDQYVTVPKDEWIRVENTHEPIISKRDYELAHKIVKSRSKEMDVCSHKKWMFAGLLYCGDCGRSMIRSKRKNGSVIRCATYSRIGKAYCTQHCFYLYELEEIVLKVIHENISDALKNMDLIKMREKKQKYGVNEESSKLQMQLEHLELSYKKMLMNLSMDIIDIEDFNTFKVQYQEKKKFINARKNILQEKKKRDTVYISEFQEWLDNFLRYREVTELSREMLVNLIERIDVYEQEEQKRVDIKFRFKKPTLK